MAKVILNMVISNYSFLDLIITSLFTSKFLFYIVIILTLDKTF